MPETASQILSYKGDAALGAGANADIPVINPNLNLDIINKTADNIALQNHEDNIRLYNQKIADRDAALQLFQQGLVSSGNIEDSDRPEYDRAKQKTEEAFYDMMAKGGINNQEAFKNYLDKAKNLNDVVIWAQGRESELSKLRQEKSQQTLPTLVQAYQDHIDQEKQKPFWDAVNPYQQAFNYDVHQSFSDVTGQPISQGILSPQQTQTGITKVDTTTTKGGQTTTKETVKQQPLKSGLVNNKTSKSPITISGTQVNADGTMSPYSFTPEMYYDLPTIQKNVNDNYASNPTDNYTYGQWFKDFQNVNKLPPAQQKESVEAMNKRIAEYSEQRGIKPLDGQFNPDGTPKYPDQITYYQRPDGSVILQETPPSFFAKSALANINGDYVQRPQTLFNKDIAAFNLKAKETAARVGALNALRQQRLSSANLNYQKGKSIDNQFNPHQVFDEMFKGKMQTGFSQEGHNITRINSSDMSQQLKDDLGIDPLNDNGDYNLIPSNVSFKGKTIDENVVEKGFNNWKNSDEAKQLQQKTGKIPSIFDYIFSQGGNFEVEVQGRSKPNVDKKTGITIPGSGGKLTRSNRLQTYINQLKQGSVKGKELIQLLSGDNASDNLQQDENTSTNESGQ